MSGSHRAHTQPPADVSATVPGARRAQDSSASYGQPQQAYDQAYGTYGSYEQSYQQPYQQPYQQSSVPHEQPYGQQPYEAFQPYESRSFEAQQPYGSAEPFRAFEPYRATESAAEPYGSAEPFHASEPYDPHPSYDAYEPEPVAAPEPAPAAAPATGSAAVVGAGTDGPAADAPRGRGHRRKAKKKTHGRALTAGTALLLAATAGWYAVGHGRTDASVTAADGTPEPDAAVPDQPSQAQAAAAAAHTAAPAAGRGESRPDGSLTAIPGLGAAFTARIPAETTQVVLASGRGKDTNETTVTLWTRTPEGRWLAGEAWAGHNANKGWTTDHNEGDLRSPIGVFSLTDAGGRKADPGSRLPYDKDANFVVGGKGFAGESLAGSFDYVVAINYNRVPGNSPLDAQRPNGSSKGGGIWIHVDHGGPTHGCVSVPEDKMAELLRLLDPAAHPVIVMGDAASLAA